MSIQKVLDFLKKNGNLGQELEVTFECVEKQVWANTNKLLKNDRNYVGIKTGITKNAGYCLSSQKKKKDMNLTCSKGTGAGNASFAGDDFDGQTVQRN